MSASSLSPNFSGLDGVLLLGKISKDSQIVALYSGVANSKTFFPTIVQILQGFAESLQHWRSPHYLPYWEVTIHCGELHKPSAINLHHTTCTLTVAKILQNPVSHLPRSQLTQLRMTLPIKSTTIITIHNREFEAEQWASNKSRMPCTITYLHRCACASSIQKQLR